MTPNELNSSSAQPKSDSQTANFERERRNSETPLNSESESEPEEEGPVVGPDGRRIFNGYLYKLNDIH